MSTSVKSAPSSSASSAAAAAAKKRETAEREEIVRRTAELAAYAAKYNGTVHFSTERVRVVTPKRTDPIERPPADQFVIEATLMVGKHEYARQYEAGDSVLMMHDLERIAHDDLIKLKSCSDTRSNH